MVDLAPVRTGHDIEGRHTRKVLAAMELLIVVALLVFLGAASALGLTTDSRDGADWYASIDGQRQPRRL
jgi:hypothetical protein